MNARLIQIMRMLEGGPKHPSEIADVLGLSPITARRHIQRLRNKGYWIELDSSGRYFILGRVRSGEKGVIGVEYGKKMEDLEEEMEKAAYKYIVEGAVSGMMTKRDGKGEMRWRFTPSDVAEVLGVDEGMAGRILSRLENARYLRCFKSGKESVYPPSESWGIFHAFRDSRRISLFFGMLIHSTALNLSTAFSWPFTMAVTGHWGASRLSLPQTSLPNHLPGPKE